MNLSQYPAAISQMAHAVSSIAYRIRSQKTYIEKLEGNADIAIAFDPNLRGRYQQQAARIELLKSTDHGESVDRLNCMIADYANALATLEQLRNGFTVLKIQTWRETHEENHRNNALGGNPGRGQASDRTV